MRGVGVDRSHEDIGGIDSEDGMEDLRLTALCLLTAHSSVAWGEVTGFGRIQTPFIGAPSSNSATRGGDWW